MAVVEAIFSDSPSTAMPAPPALIWPALRGFTQGRVASLITFPAPSHEAIEGGFFGRSSDRVPNELAHSVVDALIGHTRARAAQAFTPPVPPPFAWPATSGHCGYPAELVSNELVHTVRSAVFSDSPSTAMPAPPAMVWPALRGEIPGRSADRIPNELEHTVQQSLRGLARGQAASNASAPPIPTIRSALRGRSIGRSSMPAVAPITPETDACLQAIRRLIAVLRKKRIKDLICILAEQAQNIEDAADQILNGGRRLDTAVGAQLDALGVLLDIHRDGILDWRYRIRLRAMTRVVGGHARPDELLDLIFELDAGFFPSAIHLHEHYPASFIITFLVPIGEQNTGEVYARILHRAKPAGVRLVSLFEEQGANLFGFDDDPSAFPFMEEGDPSTGGIWAEGV